jgi:hypothetical protein
MPTRRSSTPSGRGGGSSGGVPGPVGGGVGGGGGGAGAAREPKSRLSDILKTILVLDMENFSTYLQSLRDAQYHWNWDPDLIDLDQQDAVAWNGQEDKDSEDQKQHRREAFTALKTQITGSLSHIRTGVASGDVKQLFQNIYVRFCGSSSGTIQTLKKEFASMSMYSCGVPVEQFISDCITKQGELLLALGAVEDVASKQELCSTIIDGLLLPEFLSVRNKYQFKRPDQLLIGQLKPKVVEFARQNKLLTLRRGAPNATPNAKALMLSTQQRGGAASGMPAMGYQRRVSLRIEVSLQACGEGGQGRCCDAANAGYSCCLHCLQV